MDPNQAALRIKELLQANLLLEEPIRAQVLALSPADRAAVIPVLEALNAKEHQLLERVLEKNPDFFDQLEQAAIAKGQEKFSLQKDKMADLLRLEASEKIDEMAELEDFLTHALH